MNPRTLIISFLLGLLGSPVLAQQHVDSTLPDWLAGHWCLQGDPKQQGEESWLPAAGGLMLGVSRTVTEGHSTQFEFMRIELVAGAPAFVAQPKGSPPTTFKHIASGPQWMRFENPAHDFPQRVEYRRDGDALHAEISGPGQAEAPMVIGFDFKRCP